MEMICGDGAAALVVGSGAPIATIHGTHSVYSDFVDHYRTEASQVDYVLEERWFRDMGLAKTVPAAVAHVLAAADISIADISRIIVPLANPSLGGAVARMIEADKSQLADPLYTDYGYTGVAHPLLMIANTLGTASPGDWILALAFGQGCDAVLLRCNRPRKRPEDRDDGYKVGNATRNQLYQIFEC